MRNLSLFSCVIALIVSSGCQSGTYGFRNPFKDQFARTFPKSVPELLTKSKESRDENQGVFDLAAEASEPSSESLSARTNSIGDSKELSDVRSDGQLSAVERVEDRADAAFAEGHLQEAAGLYRDALQLNPEKVHAHHRLAIIHDQQQDYAVAEQHYEAALRSQPKNVSILNDLGYSYYLQQQFEDSKAYLNYILQLDQGNQLAMRNLALVHAAEGDLQQASALFQQGGLNSEQSQQQIQLAVARVGEGKDATIHSSRKGFASTNSQPGRTSAEEGTSIVGTSGMRAASVPGDTGTRSNRGSAFQPQPDWDSAYGMNSNHPHNHSARVEDPTVQSSVPGTNPSRMEPSIAQRERPQDYAVERVSYSPSVRPTESVRTDADMIRTALNIGYGHLFPVISPEDYDRKHSGTSIVKVHDTGDARNAYYEQFGHPGSRTPHVVHATASRQFPTNNEAESISGGRESEPVMQRVSYSRSSRIQSPSYEPGRGGLATETVPTNAFPVTESHGRSSQTPDFSRFPKQERPPFAESAGSVSMTENTGRGASGTVIMPVSSEQPHSRETSTSSDQRKEWIEYTRRMSHEMGTDHSQYRESSQAQDNIQEYGASQVIPMSAEAREAHDLALERFRRQQQ